MQKFIIQVEYYNPKTGEITVKENGTIYGIKALNKLMIEVTRKRNVVSVNAKEVVSQNTNRGRDTMTKENCSEPDGRFQKVISELIGTQHIDNNSNTPAFILAEYARMCLNAFDAAVKLRDDLKRNDK